MPEKSISALNVILQRSQLINKLKQDKLERTAGKYTCFIKDEPHKSNVKST